MYDTKLPDIFIVIHGIGTVLGKASYSDFFVVFQGCTVGINKGKYPTIGKGVTMTSHSSIIGDCTIGDFSTISSHLCLIDQNANSNEAVFRDNNGRICFKESRNPYVHNYFYIK
jgi:serine O-acetyltransferase